MRIDVVRLLLTVAAAATLLLSCHQLTNPQKLSLSGNQLTELPPELGQLTDLQELGLIGNHLTGLPPEICQMNVQIDIREELCGE